MNQKFILISLVALLAISIGLTATSEGSERLHSPLSKEKSIAFVEFQEWMAKHNRAYRSEEERSYRFAKYFENYMFVKEHNARFEKGLETFDVELNMFADLDRFEFKAIYNGLKRRSEVTNKCTGEI